MRFSVAFRAILGVLALTGVLAAQTSMALAQSPVPADKRLPAGVLLYLSSPNLKTASESFKQTNFGQLIQDPAVADFKKQLATLIEDAQKDVEQKVGVPTQELLNLVTGEVAFSVVRPVGQPIGYVTLVEIGNGKATVETLLEKARSEATEVELVIETETIEGVEVTTVTATKLDDEDATPQSFTYAFKDQHFLVASTIELVESVLVNWAGSESNNFSDNVHYQAILKKSLTSITSKPALVWYADPVGLLAAGLSASPATQAYAGLLYTLPQLGLTGLKAAGGVIELATSDFDYVSRSLIVTEGAPTGIAKLFLLKPNALSVPDWVSADSSQFTTFEWDVQAAYQGVETLYDTFASPGSFALISENILVQSGINLKLKSDVIDALSGKFTLAMANPSAETNLFTVGLGFTSQEKGEKLINAILPLIGSPASTVVSGAKLYTIPAGENEVFFALKDSVVYVSNNDDSVKTALSGISANPLKNSDKFKAVQQFVPSSIYGFTYNDPAKAFSSAYEQARSGALDGLVEGKLDFSVLPEFSVISKYFTAGGQYNTQDENGVLGVQFGLK